MEPLALDLALEKLLREEYTIEERMMLSGRVLREDGKMCIRDSLRKAQQETQIAGQDGETLSLQESRPDGASGGQNAGTVQETAGPEPQGTQENGTDRTAEGVRPAQPVETGYAYSLLDEEEKSLYLQMLQSITGFSQETELTTLKPELLEPVFNSVLADHPEIFYVDGYTYTKHTLGEEIHKITFTARYTLTQAEAEQRKKGIEAYIETALSGIHSGMDDYQKIKYIYDYMIEHTDYRLDSPENQTVCSVFLYGESVCQGYAKAFQLLCSRVGIPAVLVTGEAVSYTHLDVYKRQESRLSGMKLDEIKIFDRYVILARQEGKCAVDAVLDGGRKLLAGRAPC